MWLYINIREKILTGLFVIAVAILVIFSLIPQAIFGDSLWDSSDNIVAYNISLEGREYLQEGYIDKVEWQQEFDTQAAELQSLYNELLDLKSYLSEENRIIIDNFNIENFNYIEELCATRDSFAAMKEEALAAKEKQLQEQRRKQEQDSIAAQSNSGNINLRSAGIVNWGGYRFTWYSQNVLPGGGLSIPGRHINSAGFVCDGSGYIVAATAFGRGTTGNSPWGTWKSYDTGVSGNTVDLYTAW